MRFNFLFLLLFFVIFSCKPSRADSSVTEEVLFSFEKTAPLEAKHSVSHSAKSDEPVLDQKIRQLMSEMSLEEKVGQLFIIEIRGYKKLNTTIKRVIKLYNPGGIILFGDNFKNAPQVTKLIEDLQLSSKFPLFIGVDEEGGRISRLGSKKGMNITHLPAASDIGARESPMDAYHSGQILGRELRALGFNMNMAPVADVNTNPYNPVIGNRAYSEDPETAGIMVSHVVKGFGESGIISVLKHFPGHGDTNKDTHHESVVSYHERKRLNQIEFIPFVKGIEAGADAIMVAHVFMPRISSLSLPASLNPDIIYGIIRKEFLFEGLIITDALVMGAITRQYTSKEAALLAIKGGNDILLLPGNLPGAFGALLDGIRRGEITEERIDESVFRILKTKSIRSILRRPFPKESLGRVKNDPAHRELVKQVTQE